MTTTLPQFDLRFTEAPVSAFIDWYQITQLQAMTHQLDHNGSIRIQMRYTVRTKGANTARLRDVLEDAMDRFAERHVMLPHEIQHLRDHVPYMKPIFVDSLRDMRLHPRDCVEITAKAGELAITIEGGIQAILFEHPLLAVISELWTQLTFPGEAERVAASRQGIAVLEDELRKVQAAVAAAPGKPFRFIEGGTRRRFTLDHHRLVLERIKAMIPEQLFGTSNICLAMEQGLRLVGTQAHLFGMLFQQHGGTLATFPTRAMQAWVNEYRGDLGYMLPDVLTTEAWLKSVDLYFGKLFDGFRQDSGDPRRWSETIIAHLKKLHINPATKFAVYSDGLNFDRALELWREFEGNPWPTSYLIGTFVTNHVPRHKPLSQVIKLCAVNGQPVAKLSDEPEKATCDDPAFLATLKKTHGIA